MPDITNPGNIPAGLIPDLKLAVVSLGQRALPNVFPKEPDGSFKQDLTNAELATLFEQLTRSFWKNRIVVAKREIEEEQARQNVISQFTEDPFAATGS